MAESAGELLRRAAKQMRGLAKPLSPGPWEFTEGLYWDRDAILSRNENVTGWGVLNRAAGAAS